MLTCKFHFIFYFYSLLKSCSFNYSNLLLLINNSFGIRHHQPCSHINLLKLTNHIKVKCLFEVTFVLYSIGYLNLSVHSPISARWLSFLQHFQKGGLDMISIFSGGCWERVRWLFQGISSFYIKNKLKFEIFNNKSL